MSQPNFSKNRLKPNRSLILFLIFLPLIILAFYFLSRPQPSPLLLDQKDLLTIPWPQSLEFCGEPVPLDLFYVREAWEKDFLVTLDQDYQNILYLKRSQKYFPYIESELRRRNLPLDLKYIVVAESAFLETTTSSASAGGLWQFIPSTARQYGLQVDSLIDQRRHYELATNAALDYLTDLHNEFGSWTLAVAAYNTGQGNLSSAITLQNTDSYYQLYLHPETSRYLFRILAAKEILQNHEKYNYKLSPADYFSWPSYQEITVTEPIPNLYTFAQKQNTTFRALKELNPWIISTQLPLGPWTIKIPNPS